MLSRADAFSEEDVFLKGIIFEPVVERVKAGRDFLSRAAARSPNMGIEWWFTAQAAEALFDRVEKVWSSKGPDLQLSDGRFIELKAPPIAPHPGCLAA